MKARLISVMAVLCSVAAVPTAVVAHHAFAAQYDREKPIEITGTVTKVEWMNPHARFYVDAPDPDREEADVVNWNFELGSPNGLMRQGWRRDSLKAGDTITVSGWRARTTRMSPTRARSRTPTASECSQPPQPTTTNHHHRRAAGGKLHDAAGAREECPR